MGMCLSPPKQRQLAFGDTYDDLLAKHSDTDGGTSISIVLQHLDIVKSATRDVQPHVARASAVGESGGGRIYITVTESGDIPCDAPQVSGSGVALSEIHKAWKIS